MHGLCGKGIGHGSRSRDLEIGAYAREGWERIEGSS
jgi:hypothetical protein